MAEAYIVSAKRLPTGCARGMEIRRIAANAEAAVQ